MSHMDVIKDDDGGIIIHIGHENAPGEFLRLGETQKNLLIIKLLQGKGISWEASVAAGQWVQCLEVENAP